MEGIYFDNNATTRVDEAVVEAMLPYFTEQFGNPSSMKSFRQQGRPCSSRRRACKCRSC